MKIKTTQQDVFRVSLNETDPYLPKYLNGKDVMRFMRTQRRWEKYQDELRRVHGWIAEDRLAETLH